MNLFSERYIVNCSEKFSKPIIPGVYFLIDVYDRVVYVGQSSDVYKRIRQHRSNMVRLGKNFNRQYFICVEDSLERKVYELAYIKKFKPMYNSTYNDDVKFNKALDKLLKTNNSNRNIEKKKRVLYLVSLVDKMDADSEKTTASQ